MVGAAYLDANAISKLFIPENDSEIAEGIVYPFDQVFTSRVSTIEVHRKFARYQQLNRSRIADIEFAEGTQPWH
jgi:predicted nucleic acid-binding protein